MKIRKQYSLAYQVLELEREVETLEEAELVSQGFDAFAQKELASMVDLVSQINPNGAKQTTVVTQPSTSGGLTEKQITTIINQLPRCKGIAKELGIKLFSESDVRSLSKEEGSKIISKMFEKKTGF